jgi:hypothetical protein
LKNKDLALALLQVAVQVRIKTIRLTKQVFNADVAVFHLVPIRYFLIGQSTRINAQTIARKRFICRGTQFDKVRAICLAAKFSNKGENSDVGNDHRYSAGIVVGRAGRGRDFWWYFTRFARCGLDHLFG